MGWTTVNKTATGTRTVTKDLGYDLIPICRPQLIFFKIVNLRPEVPHWIFFDGQEVTKWVNTSYSYSEYESAARDSNLKDPGDEYINATEFPHQLGGPTNASGPINSGADGVIEGIFYLQSNSTTSFKTGKRLFTAIDISVLKKEDCLSFAQGEYQAIGEYQLYNEYQETYTYTYSDQVWVNESSNDTVNVEHKRISAENGGGNNIHFNYSYETITHTYDDDGNFSVSDNSGGTWSKSSGGYWTRTF